MGLPQTIAQLVANFAENQDHYLSNAYNETLCRIDFINPLLETLGWDMNNRSGYADAYRDVIHEDAIRIGSATKAPDYCFRIGGARKFFLEAKRPAVDLKTNPEPAFQLRRYAWSAKLPLSILTDFEEFAVYDCRIRPAITDKPSVARIFYCRYTEYEQKWDEIVSIFSREAILRGSFDKYAADNRRKRGTTEVDDAFLQEIESWRDTLARNIALRNPKLSQRDLNFAVTCTIDRIIFLRMAEDRGLEPHGQLRQHLNGDSIYRRLFDLFRRADEKYNSGLFHFDDSEKQSEPVDTITPTLDVDDKVIKDILKNLYYPDSPYEFSVIPADILGQVYEQFLGKVITLTEGHRARVEEKPEVRKAGGVYYTPTYIVDYIVKQTVGNLLEGKTPKEAAHLKILDPACGSGSFLIGAYQYLLDWHLTWYSANEPVKWLKGKNPAIYQSVISTPAANSSPISNLKSPISNSSSYRLTSARRKEILLNSIFGVDIDTQAVEVTKLSLLLKVLEGETAEGIDNSLRLFRERALPDLGSNIKCGNSLIGPDFYDNQQMLLIPEEDKYRINVFDWKTEFADIFKKTKNRESGFDAVIGNPPYVLLQDEFRDDAQLAYFRNHYLVASFKVDLYHMFIERGVKLLSNGGRFSLITPANFLANNHLARLRRFLLSETKVERVDVIDGGVFAGVSVDNAILTLSAGAKTLSPFVVAHCDPKGAALRCLQETWITPDRALRDDHVLFLADGGIAGERLWDKIEKVSVHLGSLCDVNFGKQLRDRKRFPNDVIEVPGIRHIKTTHVPCYNGRDITRYGLKWGLLACLNDTVAQSGGCWDPTKHRARNKLLTRQIGRYPEFALDADGYDCLNTMFMVNPRGAIPTRFLLAVLNSRLLQAFWLARFYDQRRTFPKIKGTYLKELPVPSAAIDDVARQQPLIVRVDQMLSLRKRLADVNTPHEKQTIERQITATDNQIDRLVYELYGLTDDEIRIVEEATV